LERLTSSLNGDAAKLLDGFVEDCRLRGMTEESIRRYRSSLRLFFGFLDREGSEVRKVDVRALKGFLYALRSERKAKQTTIENDFSALSAFYEYLIFEGASASNPVTSFRKRYVKRYKEENAGSERRLLTVEEMSRLVNSILDPRDKAIALLFCKTGIRRGELLNLDTEDVNWVDCSITLKPTPKRSNRVVFFDDEAAFALRRWLKVREKLSPKAGALFVSYQSLNRLDRNGCYEAVVKYARRLGFHDSSSDRVEDHFGPHCFRHFFTTMLLRNGMPREYVKELRGDSRNEAIDLYNHIDREELRRAYLAAVPKLGV